MLHLATFTRRNAALASAAWCLLWLTTVTACEQTNPPPELVSIEPEKLAVDRPTTLTIRGNNFFGDIERAADGRLTTNLDFRVSVPGVAQDLQAVFVDTQTLTVTIPGLVAGTYGMVVRVPAGTEAVQSALLTVAAAHIVVEDAPAGQGSELDGRELTPDQTVTLYAIVRFADDGTYIADESVAWSADGSAGTLNAANGTDVTFHATGTGTSVVTATHPRFGMDATGDLTIAASECGTCNAGACTETCSGDCSLGCNSSCTCNLDCAGTAGTCGVSCAGLDTCDIDCTDVNNCDTTCAGNAVCDIDCTNGNNCDQTRCQGNAQCLIDCTGANNCGFQACGGAELTCAGNIIVCNRPCP